MKLPVLFGAAKNEAQSPMVKGALKIPIENGAKTMPVESTELRALPHQACHTTIVSNNAVQAGWDSSSLVKARLSKSLATHFPEKLRVMHTRIKARAGKVANHRCRISAIVSGHPNWQCNRLLNIADHNRRQ
jgi:hypothetical protein